MNARIALLVAPLALLAACSDDDPTVYTLSGGTYAVSGASVGTAAPGDQCGLLSIYQATGKQIAIAVNGTTATFDLSPVSDPAQNSSATINGNSIDTPVEANFVMQVGSSTSNCSVRVQRTVVGELTANDQTALQMHALITIVTNGGDCNGDPWDVQGGCQSDIHFLANKVVQ